MHHSTVIYRRDGPVGIVGLHRPDKLNAIDDTMVAELNRILDLAEEDPQVQVILLRGEGSAFSAGFDLQSEGPETSRDMQAMRAELRRDFDIIMRFWNCPKVTVAAVHGYCLGSAMEMAIACDLTIAAAGCRFGAPEVCFGSGIVALILPWLIGPKRTKELLLTGMGDLSAERAEAIGLVNRVVPADRLEVATLALARRIVANDTLAVKLTKQAINRSMDVAGMRQAMLQGLEIDVIIETTETADSREFNEILERDGVKAALAWRRTRTLESLPE